MDTQDAQKTSNRAHKKTLKQKKTKNRFRATLWNKEQIWNKCSAAEKLVLHSQTLNFTILQTTKYDLVNSLHTSGFLNRQSMKSFLSTC